MFDIDGTILDCFGAGKQSLIQATLDVFGTAGRMKRVDFQGKTDPLILRESLLNMGVGEDLIVERTHELKSRYFDYLSRNIREFEVRLLPGIDPILRALSGRDDVILGVLTGNFRESALIKLGRYALAEYFRVSVYGDDAPLRTGLPPVARRRIREVLGVDMKYDDMVIIGDTTADIDCAAAVGAVSVSVGTGWAERDALLAKNPDHFFEDLSDTDGVLGAILGV